MRWFLGNVLLVMAAGLMFSLIGFCCAIGMIIGLKLGGF